MNQIEVPRERGQIAVQLAGNGPLILCIPGMCESHASFRHLTPGLVDAGYQVAVMDLRGHGESSADFGAYDDPAAAGDILAVLGHLGSTSATLVGNSMGAAAAVLAATQRPELIKHMVLIGPFVRNHGSNASRHLMNVALKRPWGPMVWRTYYKSLFGKSVPADHDAHVERAIELLRRPGRWQAFQATARTSHAPTEAALPQVSAPTLVIMGEKDRDFSDPAAEAKWVAEAVGGEHRIIAGTGHYPMGEQPQAVLDLIRPFLESEAAHG